MNKILLV
jgi:hypothetical protein